MKRTFLVFLALWCVTAVQAGQDARWSLQTSVYTTHFDPEPEHNSDQELFGLEYEYADTDLLLGGASFRNSFDQRSTYVYAGWRFEHHRLPVYAKLTGGLLRGYSGEYRDKIPLNRYGVAPVVMPSAGAELGQYTGEVVLFGLAGMIVNMGFKF